MRMNANAETKDAVRRRMRAMRKALSPAERERASRAICEKLAACAVPTTGAVAVYLASPDEIDLSPFVSALLARGVAVAAPRWNGREYDLARLKGLGANCLRRGPMNILEPADPEIVEPSSIATWIVPGLAFTKDGARLGYGGGWYDRLLAAADGRSEKIGVAYDFQVVPDLPRERHDVPLTRVVSAGKT